MTRSFAVTWDYRCPFARNAHEHVLAGLAGGADWDVTFVPFSLGQVHVAEGEPPIWDRPGEDSGLLALRLGVAVRDQRAEVFPAVHRDLFALRHDHAGQLSDPAALREVLAPHVGGEEADRLVGAADDDATLATVRAEHERVAAERAVWGVPTFMAGPAAAVFVRLMDRNPGVTEEDRGRGRAGVERILDLVEWDDLNEYKHTSIAR